MKKTFLILWLVYGIGNLLAFADTGTNADRTVSMEKHLLAHWTFDETNKNQCLDASAYGRHAIIDASLREPFRVRGISGKAVNLSGAHALKIPLNLPSRELRSLTIAAWLRPVELSGYREIFRQESDNRILFSFQASGTILSLGLNIGGYVECDASIQPEQVLDGQWHHGAAVFDGEWMRVYLDGKEIGSLHRPGCIAISQNVPAFIGSMGGQGEHFQGALDDLQIYENALKPDQIQSLYQSGSQEARAIAQELDKSLNTLFPQDKSFSKTLVSLRKMISKNDVDIDLSLALQARLRNQFPTDMNDFAQWTRMSVHDYIFSSDPALDARLAGRLVDLLMEYKPITDEQWKQQSADDIVKWKEADQIKQRYDHLVAKTSAGLSADYIDFIMAAGPKIQVRPWVNEAVAPYLKPQTPVTTNHSLNEARTLLEKDWLFQADQAPTPLRIKSEIQWARELADRLSSRGAGVSFRNELAALEHLAQRAANLSAPDRELYFQVRQVKREIMLKNPAIDFQKILLVDMPFPQGSEWQHETRHRLGYMAVPGGRLLVLDGLRPDGTLRQLAPQAPLHGSFWRADVSYDGRRILFCFKPHNEKSFHLYEVGADGSGLKQLTDGPFDDLDPIYLPDERHLVFSTTRGNTYVRCMPPTSAFVLARCDRDGGNIYLISANNEPDYLPSVMEDGRILYTRWEYTDKPLWRAQKLWTVNPDGTQVLMFWGNQSVWPDLMKDARNIPGSRRIMFTGSAHHNWFSGSVGIIDPDEGFNFPWGLTKVTADVTWPECGNGPVDPVESPHYHSSGKFEAYYSPYPLSERDFLVSAQRNGKFALYLMDVDGNRELIYEGTHHVLHAMPLKARPSPTVIADRVIWPERNDTKPPQDGVIFSGNIYEGAPVELRGKVRFLRILSIDHKTYTYWYKRPYISTGPVVSAVQSEGVKRILGTVPVDADGSVAFNAPAGLPLHFQLLDEHQLALQTMRSFVNVMPGEQRGCLGCHESHSRSAKVRNNALALSRPPHSITPPPWSDHSVSYPRYVQPVLDKYCGKCHQGSGEARKVLDLTERPSSPVFTEPYLTLIGRPSWGQPYQIPEKPVPGFGIAGCLMVEGYGQIDPQGYVTPPPMTSLSYRSKLIEMVTNGKHYDVKVDEISRLRLIAWVDAMCPYMGDEEIREIPDPIFQGVDWLAVRPKIATAPRLNRPGPVD